MPVVLKYEKLTLKACKDPAKNRRILTRTAVQVLSSQQPPKLGTSTERGDGDAKAEGVFGWHPIATIQKICKPIKIGYCATRKSFSFP